MSKVDTFDRAAIALACKKYGARRLQVFGSATRNDFEEGRSDVDFLVDFAKYRDNAFGSFFGLKEDLEAIVNAPVDLVVEYTVKNPFFKQRSTPRLLKSMRPESKKLLLDARTAARSTQEFTEGMDIDDYLDNKLVRSAVERQFEIVGEALNRLRKVDIEAANNIDAVNRAVAFRNILIHVYDGIDDFVVWDAIRSEVPSLLTDIDKLVGEPVADDIQ